MQSKLIKITPPQETEKEAAIFKKRKQSLQLRVGELNNFLKELDLSNMGQIDSAQANVALQNLQMNERNDPSINQAINNVLKSMQNNEGQLNYNELCEKLMDPNATLAKSYCSHSFFFVFFVFFYYNKHKHAIVF